MIEQSVARLEAAGWYLWHVGRDTRGLWSCRLYSRELGDSLPGQPGAAGFDLPCWRYGTGPTMLAAVSAAAAGLLQQREEEAVDLADLLR